ncbi:hypothetical protein, partial [Gracilibacillus thailandensis]
AICYDLCSAAPEGQTPRKGKWAAEAVVKRFTYFIINIKVIEFQLAFNKGPEGVSSFSYNS